MDGWGRSACKYDYIDQAITLPLKLLDISSYESYLLDIEGDFLPISNSLLDKIKQKLDIIRSAATSFTWPVRPEKVFFWRNTKTSSSCLHVNKAVRTNFNTKLHYNYNTKAHSF